MLIHCTLKLSRKLQAVVSGPLPVDSPLGSWTANLLVIDRRQCVLACHDHTRFPLFLPGLRKEQFQELGPLLQRLFIDCLRTAGFPESQVARAKLALGAVHFDRQTDRSVLATMNQFGQETTARVYHRLPNVLLVDPVTESLLLADSPITVHGKWVDWPLKGMQKLLADLPV